MRILFYCQHSMGLGHLMRTLRIAEACSSGAACSAVLGGSIPENLIMPPSVEVHRLSPLAMSDGELISPNGTRDISSVMLDRVAQVRQVAHTARPHVLVVEMFPLGRKKFRDEIVELISLCKSNFRTIVICSVRDILVSRGSKQSSFDRAALETLNGFFDQLLIHSDPKAFPLSESFSLYHELGIPKHYTGYICAAERLSEHERKPRALVSVGGGLVGKRLLQISRLAAPTLYDQHGLETLILSGALSGEQQQCEQSNHGLTVAPFADDFPQKLSRSQVSVSQCGYNTAADILRTNTPAVFVPFETDKEDEQIRRARRLQQVGRAVLIRERELTVKSLIRSIVKAHSTRPPSNSFDLDGVKKTRQLLLGMELRGAV